MPFKKGECGNPLGKPVGASRKKDALMDVAQICKDNNFNPFECLIELATKEGVSDRIRCDAASELAAYLAPKLKCIDHTSEDGSQFMINLRFASSATPIPKVITDNLPKEINNDDASKNSIY